MEAVQMNLLNQSAQSKPKTVKIVNLKMVKEKNAKYNQGINMAQDIVNMVRDLYEGAYREMVVVVGVDTRNFPTIIHVVGVGSPNQSPVFASNVIKPLLLSNSSGFILIHNHPADTLTPSRCDIELTRKLLEIGKLLDLTFLDHIILNHDASDFTSMRSLSSWPE